MKKIMFLLAAVMLVQTMRAYDLVATIGKTTDGMWQISIDLSNNNVDLQAFQMDLLIDGETELSEDNLSCGSLLADHTFALGTVGEYYRLVGYSPNNTCFTYTHGELMTLLLPGDFTSINIDNILFADSENVEYRPSQYSYSITNLVTNIEEGASITEEHDYNIHDLIGRKVNVGKNGIIAVR